MSETAWQYLIRLHKWIPFWSVERPGTIASASELKRWLINRAVLINGVPMRPDDPMPDEVTSLILFPKGSRRTTIV